MGDVQVFYCLSDFLQVFKNLLRTVAQGQCHKFLAAIAGKKIRTAFQIGRRCLSNGSDHLISGRMAKGIVIHFEAVNIKHTDGERNVQADRFSPFCRAVLFIPTPVGNSCQLVGHGLLLNLSAIFVEFDMCVDPCLNDQGNVWLCNIIHGS